MSELMRNFFVGLCSIIGLIGFAVLLMFFGELDIARPNRYQIVINMNQSGGLRPGSPVELNGVSIGQISGIALQDDPEYPVRVVAEVDMQQNIPSRVVGQVDRSLLAGAAVLQIISRRHDPDRPHQYLQKDGTAQLHVTDRTVVEQITEALDERTKPLIDGLERFNQLSDTYITLGENLNEMVLPQDQASLDAGAEPNLRTAVVRLNQTLVDAQEALRLAGEWLGDEQLQHDVRGSVTKAQALIEKATATFERYSRLADSLEGDARALLQRIVPVTDELGATLAEVRRVMMLAADGDGTVAQLLNNPDLYNALDDAARRLEEALCEAQLLMQKIKAEGLPVQF